LVDPGVELAQGANVERELLVFGRQAEAVVVEVVVGLDRKLAEVRITNLLGAARGRRIAARGLRTAPRAGLREAGSAAGPRCVGLRHGGYGREPLALVTIHRPELLDLP